jgi:hypothetical protein
MGILIYVLKLWKRIAFWKGYKFANYCTLHIFISDGPYFVPIKVASFNGPLHLLALEGNLLMREIRLLKRTIWDVLLVSWQDVLITKGDETLKLPSTIKVSLWHKYRLRRLFRPDSILTLMVRQGDTWYCLTKHTELQAPPLPEPPNGSAIGNEDCNTIEIKDYKTKFCFLEDPDPIDEV